MTYNGSPYDAFLEYWNARPNASLLSRMLYADQKTYLVELLMKQDRMSMATSIESRVPLLDHQFVEFSTRVPDNMKIARERPANTSSRKPWKTYFRTISCTARKWDSLRLCGRGCSRPRLPV